LDLIPSAGGIHARVSVDGETKEEFAVDLTTNPQDLAERWLAAGGGSKQGEA
jgi:hypothetical protein